MRVRIHSEFCGFLMLVLAICGLHFSAARAESYDVGPGFAYENIGDVAWETLDPGDSVRIHYRETHYHEKWGDLPPRDFRSSYCGSRHPFPGRRFARDQWHGRHHKIGTELLE
ncbi:MAG: hypothetical protein KJ970_16265 [Candidatus Eisenbacteria bacterium]|uniref:Uncharacterized protein n=1 Tax=Eiseniibacteriota bacterium TaxID=2212470 RepID=A0A948RYU0_UNCEI|nr:hypothetical protein [Candidatus Eisenbacteria bacterium]